MAKKKNKLVSGYFDATTDSFVTDANIEEDEKGFRIVKSNNIAPAPSVNNNRNTTNSSFISGLMNTQNDVFSKVMTFQNQQPSILDEDNSLDTYTDTGRKYGDYFYFDYENKKDNKIYKKGNNYYLFDDKTNSYVDVNQATNRFTDKKIEKEELEKAKQLGYKEQERKTSKEYDKANSVFKKLQKQYKLSDKELQNFIDTGNLSQKHVSIVTNSMRNLTEQAVKYRNDIKEGKIKQYDDTILSINDRLDLDTANLKKNKYSEYEEDLLRQQEARDNQKDRINYGYDGTLSGTLKALNSTKNKANDKFEKEVIYPIKHAKENYEYGKKNNQIALEYYKKMQGKKNNAEELTEEMNNYQYFNKDLVNNPGWAGTAIQNANTQVESIKKQGIGATVLGTIGSVVGTVINPGAGTVAGLKAGSYIGYTLGSTPYTYKLEAGNQYKTLLEMGVPDNIAKKHSKRVGAINAAIESGENIVDLFTFNSGSGTKAITKQTVSDLVDEYGEKQVNSWLSKKIGDKAANMMVTSAKSYLQNIASESVEEMTQEATSIVGERLAAKESNIDRDVFLKKDIARVLEAGSSAAISTAFTAPISSVSGSIATNTMNNIQSKIENKVVKSNVINNEIMKEINKSNSDISNEDALNIQRQVYQELDNNGVEIVNAQQNNKNEKYFSVNPPMVIKYQETDNQKINTFRQSVVREEMLNSKKTTDTMNVVEKIIKDKDYSVIFDRTITNLDGKSVDGKININKNGEVEIALNPNSDRAVEFLLTHEVTHAIETKELRGIILDYANKNPEFKSALKDLQKTYNTENVNDEVIADISGQILGNQEFINSLSTQSTPQSRNIIKNIYESIKRVLNNFTSKGRYRNFVQDLETKWRDAYRVATNETTKNNLQKIEKYSMQSKENNTQELDNSSFSLKEKQLEIIKKENPMLDDYHTGIRTIDDIKTPEEAFKTKIDEDEDYSYPDFTQEDGEKALESGKITVYSSKKIKQGTFVSPSKSMVQDYAGDGKIFEQTISINDVAWINSDEGQYAKVDNSKHSQKSSAWQEHLEKNYKATGTRTYFDEMTNKTKKAIAPIMRNVDISENNNNVVNNDKINLDDYDSKTERVIKSAERNVIVRSYKQLDSFIDEALDTQSNKALHFGRINETITQRIKRKLENLPRVKAPYLTKEKYDLVMNQSEIRHLIEDKTKMTRDDVHKYVKVLPDIVSKFDSASYSMENDSEGIRFKKKLPDGNYISFVLVSNKQGTLKAKSIHLDKVDYEAKKRSISPTNDVLKTPNRTSETDGAFASLDNNTTTNSQKKQIAPVSQYNMQQNEKNIPIAKEYQKNTIDEKIESDDNYLKVKDIPKDPTKESSYDEIKKNSRKEVTKQLLDEMGITDADLSKGKHIFQVDLNRTDPIRVNEKIFGAEIGKKINEVTIEKTKHNEAERMRWLNKEREEIKKLGIKPRSKESAAVQKYGEKQYIDEYGDVVPYTDIDLMNEFPNVKTQEKIKNAAKVIRNKYDVYIEQINNSLTDMGYDPIKKRTDYMRHFQALNDVFSRFGTPINKEDMNSDVLPTDINGLTDQFKPGKQFFTSALKRMGMKTSYDAIIGIDGYLEGASNLIYHTADIQRYRALSKYIREIYGTEHGFENLEELSDEEATQRIKDIQSNKLSQYAAWLDEQANALANKKGKIDRGIEEFFGRKIYTLLNKAKQQVGSNMTGFNIASAITNFASAVQGASKTSKISFVEGTVSAIKNIAFKDNLLDKSDFLTSRLKSSEALYKKPWQKISNVGQIFMNGTDYFTANQIWRSKYFENLHKGMTESDAIKNADDFSARIMGDRSKGAMPQLFNSKTMGLITQFQLEVNNQWLSMIHDNKMDIQNKNKTVAGVLFNTGQLFALSHFANIFMKAVMGRAILFDPIEIILKLFRKKDKDEDESISEKMSLALDNIADNLPFVNIITPVFGFGSGGRIPISEAFKGMKAIKGVALGTEKGDYGNNLSRKQSLDNFLDSVFYWTSPTGYGQIKKTTKGLSMFSKDKEVKGNYSQSGNLRFPVADTISNRIQAGLFGQYASKEAQDYFDNNRKPLKENQQQMYQTLNVPIDEYWSINKEINSLKTKLKGKSTDVRQDKIFNYIDDLDISNTKKSILKKSIYKSYKEDDDKIKNYINNSKMSKTNKKSILKRLGLDK